MGFCRKIVFFYNSIIKLVHKRFYLTNTAGFIFKFITDFFRQFNFFIKKTYVIRYFFYQQ